MTTAKAGWYPDPLGGPHQRFFDGAQWTDHYTPRVAAHEIAPPHVAQHQGMQPQSWPESSPHLLPEATARKRNPLFFVLAVLSGIPTAVLGLMYITGGQSNIIGLGLIWSFMWTWVWWKLSDRYR